MNKRMFIAGLLALFLCAAVTTHAAGLKIPRFGLYIPSTGGILEIPIVVDSFPGQIGGFRLCLAERGRDFAVLKVEPGEMMTTCGWEYLNWRRIAVTGEAGFPWSVSSAATTDLIEITGYASVTSGYQPTCFENGSRMELVKVHVALATPSWTGDINTDCSTRPLDFYWRNCDDNILISKDLDTVFTASELWSPIYGVSPSDSLNLPFPGFGPPDATCSTSVQIHLPSFRAANGYYDIICHDSTNPWIGDINCDGYAYTIADAIAYTRYFVWGIGTLFCGAGSIQGSDINQDGLTLTVSDLVLLTRVTIGDGFYLDGIGVIWESYSAWKPGIIASTADINIRARSGGSTCAISSDADIAACYVRLVSNDDRPLSVSSFGDLAPEAMIGAIGDTITLLWINQTGEPVFGPGSHALFSSAHPNFRVVHSEIVDMNARPMAVTVSQSLPIEFRLEQNIPNPFNPTTVIGYSLPTAGHVTLDIYNVNGQRITRLVDSDQEAGHHIATWVADNSSGSPIASGIYFYRLETNGNVATRKMLLLK